MTPGSVTPPGPADAGTFRHRLVEDVSQDRPRIDTVPTLVSYSARLSRRPEFARGVVDVIAGGASLGDHEKARQAAVGEAVERFCGNYVPELLQAATYGQLARTGHPVVDPSEFALYSRTQYAHRGFPFVPMGRDLPIAWTSGHDLSDGSEVLVPASLVYVNYFRRSHASEPPTNYPVLAGTAAGATSAQAREAALREVLERDAVTLWWASRAPAAPLALEADEFLTRALVEAGAAGLNIGILRIPSTVDALVVGAFIEDSARQLVAFGSACRASPREAAAKALTEALGMHETGLELLEHDSGFWRSVRGSRAGHRPYRPYRADRAYLRDFRPDWRDVNDVRLHLQVYLDPQMQDARLDRLRFPGRRADTPATTATDQAIPALLQRLEEQGLRAIAVDLTTAEARAAGL